MEKKKYRSRERRNKRSREMTCETKKKHKGGLRDHDVKESCEKEKLIGAGKG